MNASSTTIRPATGMAVRRVQANGQPGAVLLDPEAVPAGSMRGELTLAGAFASSCIPIYQQIARRLGQAAYHRGVRAMHYGNRRVDGAPLDSFWLQGPLPISARQQVRILERLRRGTLPVATRAMREVREMMVTGRTAESVLRAKTGYVVTTTPTSDGGSAGSSETAERGRSREPRHHAARAPRRAHDDRPGDPPRARRAPLTRLPGADNSHRTSRPPLRRSGAHVKPNKELRTPCHSTSDPSNCSSYCSSFSSCSASLSQR